MNSYDIWPVHFETSYCNARHLSAYSMTYCWIGFDHYGLLDNACALIVSYVYHRWQEVRLGAHCSEWSEITNRQY